MREATQPSQGPLANTFKLLQSLAEFTPLRLTALGPTFRKSGPSFSLVHLEQFYLPRLEIFKVQGERGHFFGAVVEWVSWLILSRAMPEDFFHYFPKTVWFVRLTGWLHLNRLDIMQVIPGWDSVPICCHGDVNPGCLVLTFSLSLIWSVLLSQGSVLYIYSLPIVSFPVSKSHQNLKQFLTSVFTLPCYSFYSFLNNSAKHSSKTANFKKSLAKKWHVLKQALRLHTETHSRTHLVSVSNAFPYIFPLIHPRAHNSLFILSKYGPCSATVTASK